MAAPPLILAALLLPLAWRTQRGEAGGSARPGLAFGGHVAPTEPRAFETNRKAGAWRLLQWWPRP